MVTTRPSPAQIEDAIRRHLFANPHAFDTARGIGEWWLLGLQPPPSPDDVASAIDRLVTAGVLRPRTLPDGQRGYAKA